MSQKKYNDRNIKEVLKEFIHSNTRLEKGFSKAHLEEIWQNEMGPIISSYTNKIIFKDGIMKVYLSSAPLRKELLMGKNKIIQNINSAAGSSLVQDIEFF